MSLRCLVVGAGPGGIAAACIAAEAGCHVTLLDDNPAPGGQIWRGPAGSAPALARAWLQRLSATNVERLSNCQVIDAPQPQALLAVQQGNAVLLPYDALVLATGARELFLPFPGWTLPNVMGIGGLQAMVKGGLSVEGKRVVLCGSGPLLLAVAATLRKHGAELPLIAEQAPFRQLARFSLALRHQPGKLAEAGALASAIAGSGYRTGCAPVRANGTDRVSSILVRSGRLMWSVPCDYLACGFGLVPNMELPRLLGCAEADGFLLTDEHQQSSLPHVYAVGEITGIGGAEKAILEGRIAALHLAGRHTDARALLPERARSMSFVDALRECFAPGEALRQMVAHDTIVCRCEDVSWEQLGATHSSREAKLQSRCGMGRCQGRICGPALEYLKGWAPPVVRPPLFPVPASVLGSEALATSPTEKPAAC